MAATSTRTTITLLQHVGHINTTKKKKHLQSTTTIKVFALNGKERKRSKTVENV